MTSEQQCKGIQRRKEYYEKNKERIRSYQKKYQQENKEDSRRIAKKYRENHPEKCLEKNRIWYSKNREKGKLLYREWSVDPENKLKRSEYMKLWNKKNKERIRIHKLQWNKENIIIINKEKFYLSSEPEKTKPIIKKLIKIRNIQQEIYNKKRSVLP
jgi:hypothetical protein